MKWKFISPIDNFPNWEYYSDIKAISKRYQKMHEGGNKLWKRENLKKNGF